MHLPLFLVPCVAVALSACGGLEITSTRATGVPPALLGEWQGQWTSSGTVGTGTISVRVQEFDGDPVVSVELDNPCIVAQVYELLFVGGGIELRSGGETVLRAELAEGRMLTGEYTCAQDSGTWSAGWRNALPTILDLSGEWVGAAEAALGIGGDLLMDLVQSVDGGLITLQGTVQLPAYMPIPVTVVGSARFRDQDFDIVLSTTSGVFPALQMAGVGNATTLAVDDGVMLSSGGMVLPFASAVWTAVQTPQ